MKPGFQRGYIKKAQFVKFLPSVNWILKKKIFNLNGQMNSKMLRNEDWDFVYKLRKKKKKKFFILQILLFFIKVEQLNILFIKDLNMDIICGIF